MSTSMVSINISPRVVAATALALIAMALLRSRRVRVYPPGPPGLPFLGNMLDLPKKDSWKVYLQWGTQYNTDLVRMRVPGAQLFVLNSAKVIQDLLVKRSNIYSNRPRSTMLSDLISTSWLIPFMNKTKSWNDYRRLFRREFDSPNASSVNKNNEIKAARRLLVRLLASNTDHEAQLRLAAVDAILSIAYGITPETLDHPFIKTPEEVNVIFADVARGGYAVDVFPFLRFLPRWIPGIQFHDIAAKGRKLTEALVSEPYAEVQRQVDNGTAIPSVASQFLYTIKDGSKVVSALDKDMMRSVLGNAYLGGADTTVCALFNFVLAMALHPHIQKKVQKELDNVLEGQRLPEFTDFSSVPYLSAVVNEVLRWHPVTPFAIYHTSTEDDIYEGYNIPKGSIMIPNAWAILHDEKIFGPNTDQFIPERFMKEGQVGPDLSDVDLAFGFGRRSCPGRLIARDTIWIMAASILTAFDISNPVDLDGNALTAESPLEFTNAMVSFAPHIEVSFILRISKAMIYDGLMNE